MVDAASADEPRREVHTPRDPDRVDRVWYARLRAASAVLVSAAALIALGQLAAWWFRAMPTKDGVPVGNQMMPDTAMSFLVNAAAYWLLRTGAGHPRRKLAGKLCAWLVVVVGLVVLAQMIATGGSEFHNLMSDGFSGGAVQRDNVVASAEGLAVLTASLALALSELRIGRWWPAHVLASVAAVMGLQGLVAHTAPSVADEQLGSFGNIALLTAVCSALLGFGTLLTEPDQGGLRMLVAPTGAGRLARRLVVGTNVAVFSLSVLSARSRQLGLTRGQNSLVLMLAMTVLSLWLIFSFSTSMDARAREREHARRALEVSDKRAQHSEVRARSILDTATDAFVGIGRDGMINEWNRSAEKLFGWPRLAVVGRKTITQTLVAPSLRPRIEADIQRAARTGGDPVITGQLLELPMVDAYGRELPVEVQIWRLESESGVSYNAFMRDVTERHRLQAQLESARDEALAAAAAKSQFLAHMSHEIRTPMNGVIGLTDLLLDTGLDEAQRRYANGIKIAGDALLTVINDILDFSKLDAGSITLEQIPFSPAQLVEDVTALLAQTAADKGTELIAYCDPGLPPMLCGDPVRLRQVLLNFTSNALKFTRRGEVVVRIVPAQDDPRTSEKRTDPGRDARDGQPVLVRFSVSDTGIGISPEDQKKLFNAFVQADASTTRHFGGTGLGLAISRKLTEAMGGTIGVDSRLGEGSTFWCQIPLPAAEPDRSEPAMAPLDGLRVLIVDDNETNRLVLSSLVSAWKAQPAAVDGAGAALAALRSAAAAGTPFGAVLLDLNMPGIDGLELSRRLDADPSIAGTYRVLLTSSPPPEPEVLRENGLDGVLTKPVNRSGLHARLAEALGLPGAAGATRGGRQDGAEPEETPPASAGTSSLGTVLLVEDNEINRAVALGFLTRLGYRADTAVHGRQALDLVAQNEYDAILMDCQMPVMDGYTATRRLREREGESGHHTPVIALTADVLAEAREECLAAGMDDYVSKPLSREALAEALHRWVGRGESAQIAAGQRAQSQSQPLIQSIRRRLQAISGDDSEAGRELLVRICAMFGKAGEVALNELTLAAAQHDAAAIKATAHRLKGSAGNVGAVTLAALCGDLETLAREGRLDAATELLDRLRTEFEACRAALSQLVDAESATTPPHER